MPKQEPLRAISDILDTPDSGVGEYEIEIDGEIILLDIRDIQTIKNILDKGILNKELREATKKALKHSR